VLGNYWTIKGSRTELAIFVWIIQIQSTIEERNNVIFNPTLRRLDSRRLQEG
jgi:hypothetical protein